MVRAKRKSLGLSQEKLAEKAGCDRQSINRVENAAYSPSLDRVFKLADALGMDGLGDDQTGDGDLTGAIHHFKDKWEYSLKKIKETAEKTAEKVTSAADGYEQVDTAVANAAAGKS